VKARLQKLVIEIGCFSSWLMNDARFFLSPLFSCVANYSWIFRVLFLPQSSLVCQCKRGEWLAEAQFTYKYNSRGRNFWRGKIPQLTNNPRGA
jgi:hypothetical protein